MTRVAEQDPTTARISRCKPPGPGSRYVSLRLTMWLMAIVVLLGVSADVTRTEADSKAAIPTYAVRVAGGPLRQKGHWGVWVFGRRGIGRCWGTRVVESGLPDETAYCGYSVPRQAQQLAARGTFPTDHGPESFLFFLTRRNVALLKVLIDRPEGRRELLRIHAHAINSDWAHRAHMQSTFGYGVVTLTGQLSCIRRIVAWTGSGVRVGASRSAGCSH